MYPAALSVTVPYPAPCGAVVAHEMNELQFKYYLTAIITENF